MKHLFFRAEKICNYCIEELQSGHLADCDEIQMWVDHTEYLALMKDKTPDRVDKMYFNFIVTNLRNDKKY